MKHLASAFLFMASLSIYCDTLQVLFLGDTYFGESYRANSGYNVIDKYGYDYFFQNVKNLLYESDFSIANLETTLYESDDVKFQRKPYSHWSYGEQTCRTLSKYGINCVSLGNNHVMDYGTEGLMESIRLLDTYKINYLGAGVDKNAAGAPFVKTFINEKDTFHLAIIGGFEYRANYDTLYDYYSAENKPGVNQINPNEIKAQVKLLREKYKDIFIVFFPHWGKNYKPVMDYQTETAHLSIDNGVDLIIGHGAHTVQEVEEYKGKLIIYNIGNFIFNAPGRYKSTGAVPFSYIVKMSVYIKEITIRLIPVYVNNLESEYQIRQLYEAEMQKLNLQKFVFEF